MFQNMFRKYGPGALKAVAKGAAGTGGGGMLLNEFASDEFDKKNHPGYQPLDRLQKDASSFFEKTTGASPKVGRHYADLKHKEDLTQIPETAGNALTFAKKETKAIFNDPHPSTGVDMLAKGASPWRPLAALGHALYLRYAAASSSHSPSSNNGRTKP